MQQQFFHEISSHKSCYADDFFDDRDRDRDRDLDPRDYRDRDRDRDRDLAALVLSWHEHVLRPLVADFFSNVHELTGGASLKFLVFTRGDVRRACIP